MYRSVLFLVMVAAGAPMWVHGHPAASTPAARFWEQALPGSPMPEAMADLIQEGVLSYFFRFILTMIETDVFSTVTNKFICILMLNTFIYNS